MPGSHCGNVAYQGLCSCYDESKRVGEEFCSIFNVSHGDATAVIRLLNVYGPGRQETDYRVLPKFGNLKPEIEIVDLKEGLARFTGWTDENYGVTV